MIVHFDFRFKIRPAKSEGEAILAAFSIDIVYLGAESIIIFRGLTAILWLHFEMARVDVRSKGYERVSVWVVVIVLCNAMFVQVDIPFPSIRLNAAAGSVHPSQREHKHYLEVRSLYNLFSTSM